MRRLGACCSFLFAPLGWTSALFLPTSTFLSPAASSVGRGTRLACSSRRNYLVAPSASFHQHHRPLSHQHQHHHPLRLSPLLVGGHHHQHPREEYQPHPYSHSWCVASCRPFARRVVLLARCMSQKMSTLSTSNNSGSSAPPSHQNQISSSASAAAAAAANTAHQPQQQAPSSSNTSSNIPHITNQNKTVVVQYIFLRRDLAWPAGAMAAQAAHASVAAVIEALRGGYEPAQRYTQPHHVPYMTKSVYGVDSLTQLEHVRDQWNAQFSIAAPAAAESGGGDETIEKDQKTRNKTVPTAASRATTTTTLYWWVEQPENIPTALATWPVERTNKVSKFIKKLNLTYF